MRAFARANCVDATSPGVIAIAASMKVTLPPAATKIVAPRPMVHPFRVASVANASAAAASAWVSRATRRRSSRSTRIPAGIEMISQAALWIATSSPTSRALASSSRMATSGIAASAS